MQPVLTASSVPIIKDINNEKKLRIKSQKRTEFALMYDSTSFSSLLSTTT